MYINDILFYYRLNTNLQIYKYVDDTRVSDQSFKPKSTRGKLSDIVCNLEFWFSNEQIESHVTKCGATVRSKQASPELELCNYTSSCKSEIKYRESQWAVGELFKSNILSVLKKAHRRLSQLYTTVS
jgi:hypothetical protein